MTAGCSSTANRQAGKHTRGNRRTDALANAKRPTAASSRMWTASVVWHPKHPGYEELQPCRTLNIPNVKSYSRVAPKHPECDKLVIQHPKHPECKQPKPCRTRNIPNVKRYDHVEPETSRMWTATTTQNPKHPEYEELQPYSTRNIPNVKSYSCVSPETSRMWQATAN